MMSSGTCTSDGGDDSAKTRELRDLLGFTRQIAVKGRRCTTGRLR